MYVRGIVFDLDGTLLDTLEDLALAANDALAEAGYPQHPVDAYRFFVGEGVTVLFQRALAAPGADSEAVARCAEAFRQSYDRRWNDHSRLYPGIPELLNELSARGFAMGIVSNKPDEFTQKCVDHFLANWSFVAVLGQRHDVPHKPDPTGSLRVAQAAGHAPQHFVLLGDTRVDMLTARRAGMHPVGALWGFRTEEELRSSGAEALIAHPAELPQLLARFRPPDRVEAPRSGGACGKGRSDLRGPSS